MKKPLPIVLVSAPIGRAWEDYEPLERVFKVRYGKTSLSNGGRPYSEDELVELSRGVDGIIATARNRFTDRVIRSSSSLKCIAIRNVGYDNIDIRAATELGILVTNAPSRHTITNVAEHTVAMILSLARKLELSKILIGQGFSRWDERFEPIYLGAGATVGIIGFGKIATQVTRLLKPFKAKILCHTRSDASKNRARRHGVKPVELRPLLSESDFVTILAPLTPETRHLIGQKEFDIMKPTAYLVNTARGAIVNEQALIRALNEGRIAGAGLDVLESEPLKPDNVFLNMGNVIVTPHIAGRSVYSEADMTNTAVKCCIDMLKGIIPNSVVNPEAIPKWKNRMRTNP